MGIIPEGFDITSNNQSPHQVTETHDTMQRIKNLIDTLPSKQRNVMHLRDIEGLSYKEIEDQLNIPMNQVKVCLFQSTKIY